MKRRLAMIAVSSLALGSIVGVLAGADAPPSPSPVEEARAALPESARIRTNPSGETYGSAVDAAKPQDEPDLILVVATNGKEGYVRRSDLELPEPRTPEMAARRGDDPAPRSLRVYESDGRTEIGEFIVNPD